MFVQNLLNMECKNVVHLCDVSLFRHDNFVVFLSSKKRTLLNAKTESSRLECRMTFKSFKVVEPTFSGSEVEFILNGFETFCDKKLNLARIGLRSARASDSCEGKGVKQKNEVAHVKLGKQK